MPHKRTDPHSLRVVLVDDLDYFREALEARLSKVLGIRVVAVGRDGLEALQLVRLFQPDVLIIDHAMPQMTGLTAIRLIRNNFPQTRIILLTMDELAAAEAVQAGASHGLIKDCSFQEILDAVLDPKGTHAKEALEVA